MAHLDRSGVGQIDRTKKIHLADIDAAVAEDGVGHRDVEKGVGDRHLQQVVLAADDLAGRPGERPSMAQASLPCSWPWRTTFAAILAGQCRR